MLRLNKENLTILDPLWICKQIPEYDTGSRQLNSLQIASSANKFKYPDIRSYLTIKAFLHIANCSENSVYLAFHFSIVSFNLNNWWVRFLPPAKFKLFDILAHQGSGFLFLNQKWLCNEYGFSRTNKISWVRIISASLYFTHKSFQLNILETITFCQWRLFTTLCILKR